jgi:SAM-dependent methyltransferase
MSVTARFEDVDVYEQQMGRWSRRLAEPFLDFAGPVLGGRVLDMGCGIGSLTFALAARAPGVAIAGIDKSPVFVAHISRQTTDPRFDFCVGDATSLPFADLAFDHALSLLVLHFVPETLKALTEMRRVTKPGGTIAAAVWDTRSFVAQRIFFDTAAVFDPRAGELRASQLTRPNTRPGELEHVWREGGLVDVQATSLTIRMDFASFADYWAPFLGKQSGGAAYVSTLSPERLTALTELVRQAYLDGEGDGPRSYTASAWAVKGRVPG